MSVTIKSRLFGFRASGPRRNGPTHTHSPSTAGETPVSSGRPRSNERTHAMSLVVAESTVPPSLITPRVCFSFVPAPRNFSSTNFAVSVFDITFSFILCDISPVITHTQVSRHRANRSRCKTTNHRFQKIYTLVQDVYPHTIVMT